MKRTYKGLEIALDSQQWGAIAWGPHATIRDPISGEEAPVAPRLRCRTEHEANQAALREAVDRIARGTWRNRVKD